VRRFFVRLSLIPSEPGPWGKAITCIIALWLAAGLWASNPTILAAPSFALVVHLVGRYVMAAVMTIAGVLPLLAIGIGWTPLRMVGATFAMATWLWMALMATAAAGNVFAPGTGPYFVFFLACGWADCQLNREIAERQWTSKQS